MQTFWLNVQSPVGSKSVGTTSNDSNGGDTTNGSDQPDFDDLVLPNSTEDLKSICPKTRRLIDWNVDILSGLLKRIVSNSRASIIPNNPDRNAILSHMLNEPFRLLIMTPILFPRMLTNPTRADTRDLQLTSGRKYTRSRQRVMVTALLRWTLSQKL
jgi:hypothetical protein